MAVKALSQSNGGLATTPPPTNFWQWFSAFGRPDQGSSLALAVHFQPPHHLASLFMDSKESTERLSVVDPASGFRCTFDQLMHGVEKLATGLHNAGIREGDVIAFFADNACAVEWTLLLWASWRIGAVFTPVEPRLLNHVSEFEEIRRLLKPAVVFAEKVPGSGVLGASSCEKIVKLVAGTHSVPGWFTLEGIATASSTSPRPPLPESQPLQRGLIMFTSGTTTTPRGCPLSHGNLFAEITSYRKFAGSSWTASAKFLVTTSVFRPICYLGSLLSWTAGGSVVFDKSQFDASSVIAAINREAITHLIVVPTQLYAVVEELKRGNVSIQSQLTFVTAAGDVMAPELLADAQQLLGPKRLVPHWGSSEGAPVLGYTTLDNAAFPKLPSGDTAVGYPLPGTTVKICSPGESDNPIILPRGERGEMHVSSPSMITNYLEGQSSSAFYEDSNGLRWWKTGDWAVMDEQGAIYIVGRLKDIIKCRGIGLFPLVMERWIEQNYGIQATMVGVPDPSYGEKPVAVVSSLLATDPEQPHDSPRSGDAKSLDIADDHVSRVVSRDEIIRSMSSELGPDFILGEVYTLDDLGLSSWPLNSFAKLNKRVLRDLVQRKHSGDGANSFKDSISDFLRRAHALNGPAQAASLYDEYATEYDALNEGGYASPRRSVQAVADFLYASSTANPPRKEEPLKVFDAGCGTGLVGQCMAVHPYFSAERPFVLDGADISPGMLDVARAKGVYSQLEVADLNRRLERADGAYDVVVCVGTLTKGHVGPRVLEEFARLTVQSGLIVATVLSEIWESEGYKAEVERLEKDGIARLSSALDFGILNWTNEGGKMMVLVKM